MTIKTGGLHIANVYAKRHENDINYHDNKHDKKRLITKNTLDTFAACATAIGVASLAICAGKKCNIVKTGQEAAEGASKKVGGLFDSAKKKLKNANATENTDKKGFFSNLKEKFFGKKDKNIAHESITPPDNKDLTPKERTDDLDEYIEEINDGLEGAGTRNQTSEQPETQKKENPTSKISAEAQATVEESQFWEELENMYNPLDGDTHDAVIEKLKPRITKEVEQFESTLSNKSTNELKKLSDNLYDELIANSEKPDSVQQLYKYEVISRKMNAARNARENIYIEFDKKIINAGSWDDVEKVYSEIPNDEVLIQRIEANINAKANTEINEFKDSLINKTSDELKEIKKHLLDKKINMGNKTSKDSMTNGIQTNIIDKKLQIIQEIEETMNKFNLDEYKNSIKNCSLDELEQMKKDIEREIYDINMGNKPKVENDKFNELKAKSKAISDTKNEKIKATREAEAENADHVEKVEISETLKGDSGEAESAVQDKDRQENETPNLNIGTNGPIPTPDEQAKAAENLAAQGKKKLTKLEQTKQQAEKLKQEQKIVQEKADQGLQNLTSIVDGFQVGLE